MKKMIKKTSALAISAFMLAQYIPFSAVAVTTQNISTGPNTIYIHSYTLDSATYGARKDDPTKVGTGTEADGTELASVTKTANNNVTYEIYSATGDNYGTKSKLGEAATDTDGELKFTGLANGVYWINPKFNSTNAAFDNADAFYVQVPGNSETVHVYPKNTNNYEDDDTVANADEKAKHTVEITKKDSKTNAAITGKAATFNVYFKNALGKWEAATPASTYSIDTTTGKLTITGLPIGDYYVVEQGAPSGYLRDQTPVPFTIAADATGVTTVNYMNDPELKVGKVISNDGAGGTYNWTITADLPAKRADLLSYVITDKFKGVDITGITIAGLNGTTTPPDFTYALKAGTTDEYEITIEAPGLAKIKDSSNTDFNSTNVLTITVSSTLDTADLTTGYTDAEDNGNAVNKASISYKYAYNPNPPTDPDIPGITDPDVDSTYPPVKNYPDSDPTVPDPDDDSDPNTPIEVIKPCTFTISNHGSPELPGAKYKITDTSGNTITGFGTITDDPTSGIATVSGLAPGTYQVHQTGVSGDYTVNNTPVTIYVSKDGNIYSDAGYTSQIVNDTVTPSVANQVVFANTQKTNAFNLPFTGTTATIVFSITGILLMAGTAFFIFIILKKRDDDEEEQENN